MLDVKLIREQPDAVAKALAQKGGAELIGQILDLDA
jgi:seryl-tRNA synthetase